MTPQVGTENLNENRLIKKIFHDDIKAFAKEELSKKGFYRSLYTTSLILTGFSFCAGAGYGITVFIMDQVTSYPIQILIGFLFSFTLLIVLHEILHGIAYKLAGAKKVYFGVILSKFVFYAGSDQEEFSGKKFRFIALFPFLVVLVAGLASLLVFPEYFLFILTVLFLHTLFCGGDFAILNFMQHFDLNKIFTYDSREKRETYFYYRKHSA